jgi:hypothetical protein
MYNIKFIAIQPALHGKLGNDVSELSFMIPDSAVKFTEG